MFKCLFKGHKWITTRKYFFGKPDLMCTQCGKEIIG